MNIMAEDSLVSARYNLKYYGDGGYILLPNGVELMELNKKDPYYVYEFVIEDENLEDMDVSLTIYEPLASEIDSYQDSPTLSDFEDIKEKHDYVLKPQGSDYQYIWAYGDINSHTASYSIDIINSAKLGYYKVVMEFNAKSSLSQQDIQYSQEIVEAIVDNSSYASEK